MVRLTSEQAQARFEEIRLWYSLDAKSDNKLYVPPASQQKIARRQYGADIANNGIRPLRDFSVTNFQSALAEGYYLLNYDVKYGNCHEMTCSVCARIDLLFGHTDMQICSLRRPGDHVFLHVGEPFSAGETMRSLSFVFDEHSYVIDIWAGIFCHVSDYALEFTQKMNKWERNHKRIATIDSGLVPPAGDYLETSLSSGINLRDPYVQF